MRRSASAESPPRRLFRFSSLVPLCAKWTATPSSQTAVLGFVRVGARNATRRPDLRAPRLRRATASGSDASGLGARLGPRPPLHSAPTRTGQPVQPTRQVPVAIAEQLH